MNNNTRVKLRASLRLNPCVLTYLLIKITDDGDFKDNKIILNYYLKAQQICIYYTYEDMKHAFAMIDNSVQYHINCPATFIRSDLHTTVLVESYR